MTKVETIKIEDKGIVEFGTSWTVEESIANVVIMSGMAEHSLRYDHFARFLNEHGFNVYCLDNFGQGKNVLPDKSNLGVVPYSAFRKQVVMTDKLVEKLRISARPTFIFAHSMGSILCQDYMQRYTHHVSKVVLCGSTARNWLVPPAYQFARLLVTQKNRNKESHLLAGLMFGGFNSKYPDPAKDPDSGLTKEATRHRWLSTKPEVWKAYEEDPLCGYKPNNGFCLELLKGMNRLYKKKFLSKVRKDLDVFIISGEGDPVANYGKNVTKLQKMYQKHGLKHVGAKVYPGVRHEILGDTSQEEVYNDILTFFLADLSNKNVV
ncbi:MAG: alpha/beta hydrolase [Coprobacillus sp.]|nr:alpha/beta hydrolase [Coprobacillus sp.]